MDRILKGRATKATAVFHDLDGVASALDSGLPSVTAVDLLGESVTLGTIALEADGVTYSVVVPAQSAVDTLTLTWTGTVDSESQSVTTNVRIVGGSYASLNQAKTMRDVSANFTDAEIVDAMNEAAEVFDTALGVPFVPRAGYAKFKYEDTNGTDWMLETHFVRDILDVHINGTQADTVANWEFYDYGLVVFDEDQTFTTDDVIEVVYEYGRESVPPDLRGAYLHYVRFLLIGDANDVPERATSLTIDGGTFDISIADAEHPTGLPQVDAALARYNASLPSVA